MTMISIKDRLLCMEQECFTALVEGGDAINTFNDRWERLVQDIDAAAESHSLEPDVMALVHSTAIRVATLIDTSVDLFTACDHLTVDFVDEMETLLSQLSMETPSTCSRRSSSSSLSTRESGTPPPASRRKRRREEEEDNAMSALCRPLRQKRKTSPLPHTPSARLMLSPSPLPSSPSPVGNAALTGDALLKDTGNRGPAMSRKRRRSDADASPPRQGKRHHIGPRLHAVSDSFLHNSTLVSSPLLIRTPSPQIAERDMGHTSTSAVPLSLDIEPMVTPEASVDVPKWTDLDLDPASSPNLAELHDLDKFLKCLLDGEVPSFTHSLQDFSPATLPSLESLQHFRHEDHTMPGALYDGDLTSSPSSTSSFPPTPPLDYALDGPSPLFQPIVILPVSLQADDDTVVSEKALFPEHSALLRDYTDSTSCIDALFATWDWPCGPAVPEDTADSATPICDAYSSTSSNPNEHSGFACPPLTDHYTDTRGLSDIHQAADGKQILQHYPPFLIPVA